MAKSEKKKRYVVSSQIVMMKESDFKEPQCCPYNGPLSTALARHGWSECVVAMSSIKGRCRPKDPLVRFDLSEECVQMQRDLASPLVGLEEICEQYKDLLVTLTLSRQN